MVRWIVAGSLAAVIAAAIAVLALVAGGDAPVPHVQRLTFDSAAVGRKQHVTVAIPSGETAGPRPLVVFLHGRGGTDRTTINVPFLAALQRLDEEAPIVAFPDGGDSSYWHDRRTGKWGRYVMKEVIPKVVAATGADGTRVAIGGISMGGFGAYDLARRHPKRFCAAGGHSPAIWTSSGQTAPGAFDDAADFGRHDVVRAARRGAFARMPLWLDAGTADPFRPGDAAFRTAARRGGATLTFRTWPGGHDGAYWNAHWRSYLRFYVTALQDC